LNKEIEKLLAKKDNVVDKLAMDTLSVLPTPKVEDPELMRLREETQNLSSQLAQKIEESTKEINDLKAQLEALTSKNNELQSTLDTLKAANDSEKLEESIQSRIESALKEQKEKME